MSICQILYALLCFYSLSNKCNAWWIKKRKDKGIFKCIDEFYDFLPYCWRSPRRRVIYSGTVVIFIPTRRSTMMFEHSRDTSDIDVWYWNLFLNRLQDRESQHALDTNVWHFYCTIWYIIANFLSENGKTCM